MDRNYSFLFKEKSMKRFICFLTSVLCILITGCGKSTTKQEETAIQTNDKYHFENPQSNTYTSDFFSSAGDFIYFHDLCNGYYGEFDTVKQKVLQLNIKGSIHYVNLYNGEYYCVCARELGDTKYGLTIDKLNINTYETTPVYTVPDGVEGLYQFMMADDGTMFFLERVSSKDTPTDKTKTDENGYDVTYSLYSYNVNTKEKTKLCDGANQYYISGNKIYFSKVKTADSTQKIFYVDFDDLSKEVDTGICCCTKDAADKGYSGRFYVKDDSIYYSGATTELHKKNINSGEDKVIYTYKDSEGYIGNCTLFGDKLIVYVRCAFDDEVEFGAKLYLLDENSGKAENIWTDTVTSLLGTFGLINGNTDYFYMSTCMGSTNGYQGNLIYPDGKIVPIYRNGIWETEGYFSTKADGSLDITDEQGNVLKHFDSAHPVETIGEDGKLHKAY